MSKETLASYRTALESSREETRRAENLYRTARQSEEEARKQFADLKERLLNAETETARLKGYLERVHEDDIVRDGFVEIEDEKGKRKVPMRPSHRQSFRPEVNIAYGMDDCQRRTHWTNY